MNSGWDRQSEPPALPLDVVMQTRAKYAEALYATSAYRQEIF